MQNSYRTQLPRYFDGLDGVRAICVTIVIAEHARGAGTYFFHLPFWLGVDVFFVLSGFLITSLLIREEAETGKIDLKAFYIRRAARILPVYYLVLTGYIVSAAASRARLHAILHYIWALLLFCMDIPASGVANSDRIPFGATWSLGIEEKFYLLWPFICFVLVSKRYRMYVIPALLIALGVLWHWPLKAYWMYRSYFGILIGSAMAFIIVRRPKIITKIALWISVPLTLALFCVTKFSWKFAFPFDIGVALILGSLVLEPKTRLSWVLTRYPLKEAGKLSYSMYLVHAAVLSVVEYFFRIRSFPTAVLCVAVAVFGSFCIGSVLHRFVETPCRTVAKAYLRRRQMTASSESPLAGRIEHTIEQSGRDGSPLAPDLP